MNENATAIYRCPKCYIFSILEWLHWIIFKVLCSHLHFSSFYRILGIKENFFKEKFVFFRLYQSLENLEALGPACSKRNLAGRNQPVHIANWEAIGLIRTRFLIDLEVIAVINHKKTINFSRKMESTFLFYYVETNNHRQFSFEVNPIQNSPQLVVDVIYEHFKNAESKNNLKKHQNRSRLDWPIDIKTVFFMRDHSKLQTKFS